MTQEKKDSEGQKKEQKSFAAFSNSLLKEEFQKETDRGAVILSAALFDIQLESLIKTYLVPDAASKDELFEGTTAPLSNFSSKIIMAYRLGLISKNLARDLNLIRKIRNEFAHNIHGCSFDHSSVKSRVHELCKSSNMLAKTPSVRNKMPDGTRGDFLINASWMLWCLITKTEESKPLKESNQEWGYKDIDEKSAIERLQKKALAKTLNKAD